MTQFTRNSMNPQNHISINQIYNHTANPIKTNYPQSHQPEPNHKS
jgi:hypothetical protein